MSEAELLARADALPDVREVGGARFASLVTSPLLIRRVRSAGGAGGRRVTAGVQLRDGAQPEDGAAFAVLVESSGREASLRSFGSAQACADAFAGELTRAARDGLGARPEPVAMSAAQLVAAGAALLG